MSSDSSSSKFDFQAFTREVGSNSAYEDYLYARRKRTGGDSRGKKTKKILNKVAAVAEKAFEIYVLLKNRKDPVGIALGAVSAYNVVSELFEKEPPQPIDWLKEMGAVKAFPNPMMCSFIYHTLRQMEVLSTKCWDNEAESEEDHAEKIEEFDLGEEVKAWFVASDTAPDAVRDPREGPWVLNQERFIERFAAIVQSNLGDIAVIHSFVRGWDEHYYLGALSIPTDLYVSQVDEDELIRRVNRLYDLGANRTMLFFGPPGVGKTTLAARIARKMGGRLFVAPSNILDAGPGRSLVEGMIDIIDPSVVLFDDLDKMWRPNDMLDSMERMNRKEGTRKRLLIGTVNTLGDIPEPMRRPGRFDEIIEFGNPTVQQREAILRAYLGKFGVDISDEEHQRLAESAQGMTGAYLQEVAKRAKVIPFEQLIIEVERMRDICELDDDEDDEDDDEVPPALESVTRSDDGKTTEALEALMKILRGGPTKRRGWRAGMRRPSNKEND